MSNFYSLEDTLFGSGEKVSMARYEGHLLLAYNSAAL